MTPVLTVDHVLYFIFGAVFALALLAIVLYNIDKVLDKVTPPSTDYSEQILYFDGDKQIRTQRMSQYDSENL